MSDNQGNNLKISTKKYLLGQLTCPVCENYMSLPIYICVRGHNICSICLKKSSICTICSNILLQITRNLSMEIMASLKIFKCEYFKYGCVQKLAASQLNNHKEICPFVPVRCSVNFCQWRGSIIQLKQHCKRAHASICHLPHWQHETTFSVYDNYNGYLVFMFFDVFGEMFQFTIKISENDPTQMIWNVALLGDTINARSFIYKIHIKNALFEEEYIELSGAVMSILEDEPMEHNGIFNRENLFKRFQNYNREITFTVEIMRRLICPKPPMQNNGRQK